MKWSEILDLARSEYLDDASEQIEGSADNQWTDATLLLYAKEGQEALARKVWPIYDGGKGFGPTAAPAPGPQAVNTGNANDQSGNPLCVLTPVQSQSIYILSDLILWVERVRISDSDLYLRRVGQKDAQPGGPYLDQPVTPSFVNPYIENPGRPIWWETMAAPNQIRFRPTVDLTQLDGSTQPILEGPTPAVFYLDVYRLPMYPVDESTLGNQPEIDSEYHMALAGYIAGCGLTRKASIDADSKRVGKDLLDQWKELLETSRRDILRRKSSVISWRYGGWANSDAVW